MAWVPPHKRPGYVPPAPKVAAQAAAQTRKIRFPTNAFNAGPEVTNVVESDKRYAPSSLLMAAKGALKKVAAVATNAAPLAVPTFRLAKLPPKYRAYLLEKGVRGANISKPAATRKDAKKGKKTRRHRKPRGKPRRHHHHTRRHKK